MSAEPFATSRPICPTVPVGPFRVADLDRAALVSTIVDTARARARSSPTVAAAIHVGGLNARRRPDFVAAMRAADLVYVDGAAVLVLARIAGARAAQRHATTDLGWEVLAGLTVALGRPARVALLGGTPGLAERAGAVLAERAGVEIALTEHGYHQDWSPVLERLAGTPYDVLFVGLGAPRESVWVAEHLGRLPATLIMTCGGWYGHVVGDEWRAPAWMRSSGLEWLARLVQSPGRLWRRYATGLLSVVALLPAAVRARRA